MGSGCEKFAAKLLDLLEGEGDAVARREAFAHMARCSTCESEYRSYERLVRELSELGDALYSRVPTIDIRPIPLDKATPLESQLQQDDVRLGSELRAIGREMAENLPWIDIREEIMASVRLMRQQEEANPGLTPELQMDFQAFMEDSLDGAGHARIEAAMDDYPAVRREFEALVALKEDLVALGKEVDASAPRIDLLRADVRDSSQASPILANTRSAREKRLKKSAAPPAISWIGLAVAACLLITLWLTSDRWLPQTPIPGSNVATHDPQEATQPNDNDTTVGPDELTPPSPREIVPEVEPVPLPFLIATNENANPESEDLDEGKPSFDVGDVLDARRGAIESDADAASRLALWASLAPEQARQIVEDSGASIEELLGAVKYLNTEEARQVLEAAVDEYPESASLRAALAKNYATDEALADASREQLAAWSMLDPENALPLYMEAQILFEQGYALDAMNTLALASELEQASGYGLESVNQHEAALIAAGLDPALAGLLAASTAGTAQYNDVTSLSQHLIAQGHEYEALGDYETAEQIYEAVRQLGLQVEQGANFTDERLAGLSAQQQALDAYGALVSLSPEDIQNWLIAISELGTNITNTLLPLRDALDSAYQVIDSNSISDLVDTITTQGDIILSQQILEVTEGFVESLTNELLRSIF